ncbi:MAG TPA: glycosyltransferase family 4 protein [Asanoa sp.]
MNARRVDVLLPNDIDDPATPSGGNTYDRRVCRGLADLGWEVREHAVAGAWPQPAPGERAGLAAVLAALPGAGLVLVDGLIASAVPDVLAGHCARLRLVVLMHMPLGHAAERAALAAAAAVVTTSRWSRRRVLELHGLASERVHAAPPGVDAAPRTACSADGTRLLCVAAVLPDKGHDVLVEALATVRELPWSLVCVGTTARDPAFARGLHDRARRHGIADRIRFTGPRTGADLAAAYAAADLLVLASRAETYGMVVTEALAHGLPVLGTTAGGLPEGLGSAPDGSLPGLLVPPGDTAALAAGLRRWLLDADERNRIRNSAVMRRTTLTGWALTARLVSDALCTVATHESAGR